MDSLPIPTLDVQRLEDRDQSPTTVADGQAPSQHALALQALDALIENPASNAKDQVRQALDAITSNHPDLKVLRSIVGGVGGEELAQALAPLALADLARRAAKTRGRDADRLWAPILAYGKRAEPQGTAVVINAGQMSMMVLSLTAEQLAAVVAKAQALPPPTA